MALRRKTRLKLVQLVGERGTPYDFTLAGDLRTYADLLTNEGLAGVARYANAIGPYKELVVSRKADGAMGADTGLARRARAAGLGVHVWTLRAENRFLPMEARSGDDPAARGDLAAEIGPLLDAGVTGVFADHPDLAASAREKWLAGERM
jgi:glycerophosphoryl diester phosphodiesterase